MNDILQASIDQAVENLVQTLKPRRVYLFGSCASGEPTEESDIDLLVVVPDEAGDKLANTRMAYQATRDLPFPKDIIVDCESVFQKRSKWVSSIEREVLETGILLYGQS
jgi:predicted nucleotidyltransferase